MLRASSSAGWRLPKGRALPAEGRTEVWPFEWGTLDLSDLHDIVTTTNTRLNRLTQFISQGTRTVLFDRLDGAFSALELGLERDKALGKDVSQHQPMLAEIQALNARMLILIDENNAAHREKVRLDFVRGHTDPEWTREYLEDIGLDGAVIMRQRQDYAAIHGSV